MADDAKPKLNAMGMPEPETGRPVTAPDGDGVRGARQDGAGAGPDRAQRSDAAPAGGTGDARRGERQGIGSRDPYEADRGDPAAMRSGAAAGSGTEAGGSAGGAGEDPDPDKGGGGRPQQK